MSKRDKIPEYNELKELIQAKAIQRGNFTLSSGAKTDIYLDLRRITLDPHGLELISEAVAEVIRTNYFTSVAGPTIGADPIVAAMILRYQMRGALIRPETKDHGAGRQIEGQDFGEADNVLLVEDVATSGQSLLKAAAAIRATGATVSDAIVVVDRKAGARALLLDNDIELHSLFTLSDIVSHDFRGHPALSSIPGTAWYVKPNPEGEGLMLCVPRGISCENHTQVFSAHSSDLFDLVDVQHEVADERYQKEIDSFCNLMQTLNQSWAVKEAISAVFCTDLINRIVVGAEFCCNDREKRKC